MLMETEQRLSTFEDLDAKVDGKLEENGLRHLRNKSDEITDSIFKEVKYTAPKSAETIVKGAKDRGREYIALHITEQHEDVTIDTYCQITYLGRKPRDGILKKFDKLQQKSEQLIAKNQEVFQVYFDRELDKRIQRYKQEAAHA